ncbi:MAG: hypothetical protein IKO76_09180 [Butyrivibrio sp.]|nr:hypothetical protein [Butyrivibrio sp.]
MMMEIRIATKNDIEYMMSSRLEMLKEVNSLDPDYQYSQSFIENSRSFFLDGRDLYAKCGFTNSDECMVLVKEND